MQTKKMSLANIQGKLSRAEMKNIMAGSSSGSYNCPLNCDANCSSSYCKCTNGGTNNAFCEKK